MANEILKLEMLENLLQRHWTDFIDHIQLMRLVMKNVSDTSFKEITQEEIPPRQIKISVTSFKICKYGPNNAFELWIEYSIPKEEGVVIGSNIYFLNLNGELILNESFGTHFRPKIS